MTILSPAGNSEMRLMFDWAVNRRTPDGPVIIRYPKAFCPEEINEFSQPLETGRGVWINKSGKNDACLAFTGSLYNEAKKASDFLKEKNISADLYNLRFLKPVDEDYLVRIMNNYKLVCFMEEGIKNGGFSEHAAALFLKNNCKAKIIIFAVDSGFLNDDNSLGTREELLIKARLDGKSVASELTGYFNS